ncbi:MAG: hypothetical protein ABIQ39_06555 [Ilumatobacteraceae bacterium]
MAQASAPTYVVAPAVNEAQTVSTVRYGSISPAAIVAGIVAVALLVIGGITVARAGIHPIDKPTDVAGFTATALLGFIELGFGVVLLIAALTRAREAILFFGIVGGVAALIAVFQPTIGNGSLAIERGFAVIVAIAMAVVVVAAVLPTIRHSSNRIERISTNHM